MFRSAYTGSTGTTAAATPGVELALFWIRDNKPEARVAREGWVSKSLKILLARRLACRLSRPRTTMLVGMEQVWKINPRDVSILNMKPPKIVAAWQRGDIDAAYVWPPINE